LVLGVQQCISVNDICDGEKYCDDGTDEIAAYFPTYPSCQIISMNNENLQFLNIN
jgi:hypothetical protein